jgi:hypothetical protein
MNFKEYVGEATAADFKAQGYGATSNKTKFQLGDYVVVTSSQTKRGEKYVGQYGKIVGYKPFQMVVKYAVEFPDGEADAYFGQMIVGPFKDEATAIKYAKQVKARKTPYGQLPQINASDIRGYVDKPLDTNPKFEAFLKQLLVTDPFGMQWLETPIQISDGKYTISILAIKPTNFKKYGIKDLSGARTKLNNKTLENYLRNNVCLLRQNNAINGRLVTENFMRGLPSFSGSAPYIMNMMLLDISRIMYANYSAPRNRDINFFDKKELNRALKEVDNIDVQGLALPVSIAKDPKELIAAFKAPYDFFSGNITPQDLFEMYYGVVERKGQKIITNTRIKADETTLKFFQNYEQQYNPGDYGNSQLIIYTDNPNALVLPPGIKKIFLVPKTKKIKPVIKDFSFIPPGLQDLAISEFTIQSLNGLPDVMQEIHIFDCKLTSLHGLPKKILGTLEFEKTNLKDFTGAEDTEVERLSGWKNNFTSLKGLPKAEHYALGDNFSKKQIQKVIDDREMLKNVDQDVADQWRKVISRL